jgi:hypothetical protein
VGVAERLTEHCKAKDFAQRLEKEVFSGLPEKPTVEQLDRAKLHAQTLYMKYRKANQCRGTFVAGHRCLVDVYHAAYDRLYAIEPVIVPPAPPRRRRKQLPPPLPTAEERAATIVGEIHATAYGLPES